MKTAALMATAGIALISGPALGQPLMRVSPAAREVLTFIECNIKLVDIHPFRVFSELPCTNLETSNTGRSVNIHFTTGAGTSTFVIDNDELPDEEERYLITGSAFTPRGKGSIPVPLKFGQGGFCSLPSLDKPRIKCSHLIDGKMVYGTATLD